MKIGNLDVLKVMQGTKTVYKKSQPNTIQLVTECLHNEDSGLKPYLPILDFACPIFFHSSHEIITKTCTPNHESDEYGGVDEDFWEDEGEDGVHEIVTQYDVDTFVSEYPISGRFPVGYLNNLLVNELRNEDNIHHEHKLYSLDLNLDTSKLTRMDYMFACTIGPNCISLGDRFDTSNVKNMASMFEGLELVSELDLGDKFDTSNVTDMSNMFSICCSLNNLDLGNKFNTAKVRDMSSMFKYCGCTLNLGDKFDTSNVTNMAEMFDGFLNIISLGDKFDTSNVTDMHRMFAGCRSTQLNLGDKFDTSKVTNMEEMFYGSRIEHLDLGDNFYTDIVNNMKSMFAFNYDLKSLNLGTKINLYDSPEMDMMFAFCVNLETITGFSRIMHLNNDTFLECRNLSYETLHGLIEALDWPPGGGVLVLHKECVERLTDEDIARAASLEWCIVAID